MSTDRRTSTTVSPVALPSEPELTQYRPISPWAVATLGAGLASPLALIGPLLWFVPLLAAPLGWLAFRQLDQRELRYIGRTATVAGLCLAALFCGWSVARRLSREVHIRQEAQQFADGWLELVLDGKAREAHQLQSPAGRRVAQGTDLASYYEVQTDAAKDLAAYQSNPPLPFLLGKKNEVKLAFAEVSNHQADGLADYFTLRYEVTAGTIPGSNGSLWLSAKRERRSDSAGADWQVTSISVTEPARQ
jgi:hypothetical protein